MTKFLNISTDNTLGGASPSDSTVSSQKAIKEYVDGQDAGYLPKADQGNIIPNFDAMTPVQTVEFNTSDTNWHTIMTRTNTDASMANVNDTIYFRITVTGTSINQVVDCSLQYNGKINTVPAFISFNRPGTTDGNYTGVRYIRLVYPKALNSGYNYAVEVINNVNSNARHYKIEVYKTNSKVSWVQGTAVTYNSTYHSATQLTLHADAGLMISYAYGTIRQSNYATQVNGRVDKYINATIQTAGAALLAASFVYQNGNKVYPSSDKTKAIEIGFGLQWNNTAYNSGNGLSWEQIWQKAAIGNLTNVPHATIARGDPLYFRCTTDSSGNIYSDNYVDKSMSAGYTWYYIGVASSSTAFALDTSQSIFMTLDANGKLTHVNGKGIAADLSGVVTITGNETITGEKTFTQELKRTSALGSGTTNAWILTDSNSKGVVSTQAYYASNTIYNRVYAENTTANKYAYLDTRIDNSGNASLFFTTNGTNKNNDATNSTSSGNVALVGWVNDPTKSTNVVHRSGNETVAGDKTFTGTNTVPTPATGDNSQQIANTAWVNANASFGAAPRDVTELYDHGYALVNSNMSIQLSESWKNFDEIVVMAKYSTGNLWPWRVSTYWLDKGLTDANTIIWTNGVGDYLTLAAYSESTPTTDTVFKVINRNLCYLGKIYGVNRKT